MHASAANSHALTDLHKWAINKGDPTSQESLDALDLVVWDRDAFASISNDIDHAVGAHDPYSVFHGGDKARKDIAGEQGQLHQFLPIAPTA
ncbi:MAG TPA: hypothetical protein VNB49_15280, partial [Candidatus Dormibacteraeota bacterium]|nr:hypothetical protein [Candidatus Dormibacteraeota bacterium]